MKAVNTDMFFKVFVFSNSFAILRQFVSLNYSIEISNRYEEAMEFILQSHRRRPFDFLLTDINSVDLVECIRLGSSVKNDFPEIKRVIVVNRTLSPEDETLIKDTFGADVLLNLKTTDDFFMFFRKIVSGT